MIEDEKLGFTYRQYLKVMFRRPRLRAPFRRGTADVEAITPEACRRCTPETIRPETILLVVAGDFDPEAWKTMIARLTENWRPAAPVRPRQDGRRSTVGAG